MIEGVLLWNRGEMEANCRILSRVAGSPERPEGDYSLFVYVPYSTHSTRANETKSFLQMAEGRAAAFLVRVDLSDVRHVVFAFMDEPTRQMFLRTEGVVVKRENPRY